MLKKHHNQNSSHHKYLLFAYSLMAIITIWKLGATLFDTAQIIRYRTIASTIAYKESKLDSSLIDLNTQIAKKKSVAETISISLTNSFQPIKIYSSLTQTAAVANLLP